MAGLRTRGAPFLLPDIHPLPPGDPDTLSLRGISLAAGTQEPGASAGRKYGRERLERRDNADRKSWERRPNVKEEVMASHHNSQLDDRSEELYFHVLEKIISGGFYELKRLFWSHDPEGRGRVSREALLVVLTLFLGRFISRNEFQRLLSRLQLDGKAVIPFDLFYDGFKLQENQDPPDWLDPMRRKQKAALRTAPEVHLELKDMANNRYLDLLRLFRKDSLTSSDFHGALSKLGVRMTEEEFQRLWHRYAGEESGILRIEDLRRHLGAKTAPDLYEDRSVPLSGLQKVSESRGDQRTSGRVGFQAMRDRKLSLSIEKCLKERFREGAQAMMADFRACDPGGTNKVSREDFLQVLERFQLRLSRDQLGHFLARCSLEEISPDVDYMDFLQRLQTRRRSGRADKILSKQGNRDETWSLWSGNKTILTDCGQNPKPVSKHRDKGKNGQPQGRSLEQLAATIRNLVKNNYESLESNFNEMDPMNTRRMTAEGLYQLLRRSGIHPEMSRKEVGKVWKVLIRNQDQTVDFLQFVRHFGFSVRSSCFPNAKISPPVRGDGDCLIRSLTLNSDTKIIANFLQTKVKLLLPDLWRQFRELDPQNSGCVTKEEFLDMVEELSPDLTKHQCDALTAKFSNGPNKISYVKFLQPYETGTVTARQNGVKAGTPRGSIDHGLNVISSKLRQKLSSVDWRNLLQMCQKLDAIGQGYLLLPEFRSVVKLCNIVLDEDDIYQILSHYDKDLAGRIDYSRLISDHKRKRKPSQGIKG
ncbi:EF-hand calcium-binding domain-containing protein 6-like [Mantella aurantiaca]